MSKSKFEQKLEEALNEGKITKNDHPLDGYAIERSLFRALDETHTAFQKELGELIERFRKIGLEFNTNGIQGMECWNRIYGWMSKAAAEGNGLKIVSLEEAELIYCKEEIKVESAKEEPEDQNEMKKSSMELLEGNERINFIDDVAKLLFMKSRGMYADDCYQKAEELWDARQRLILSNNTNQEQPLHIEIATQEWIEDGESKTGFLGCGWKFDDGDEPLEQYWDMEITDWDKYGNPIKANFTKKQ